MTVVVASTNIDFGELCGVEYVTLKDWSRMTVYGGAEVAASWPRRLAAVLPGTGCRSLIPPKILVEAPLCTYAGSFAPSLRKHEVVAASK